MVNRTLFLEVNSPLLEKVRFFINARGYYDVVFFPFTVKMRDLMIGSLFAGIPHRIGHTGTVPRLYNFFFTEKVPFRPCRHEVDLYLDLLEPLTQGCIERRYEQTVAKALKLNPMIEKEFDQYLKGKPFLTLQIAAANGSATAKVWPREHWRALIARLLEVQCRLVILGDTPEFSDSEQVLKGFYENVLNLVGKTVVSEAALIISMSQGVICHDSGLMHMADALGIPLLALYGPTDFDRTRPLGKRSYVIKQNLDCMPCLVKEKWSEAEAVHKCPSSIACMRNMTSEMVFNKVCEYFLTS